MILSVTSTLPPLQIGWFLDPEPSVLPIWLIALGLEAMFLGGTYQAFENFSGLQNISQIERAVAVGGLGFGYLFLTLSVLRTSYAGYAAFLYLVFRGVEGVAATHLYVKIYELLQGKGLSGNYALKAKHILVVFFVFALGSYLVLKAIVDAPQVAGYQYDLTMVYTGVVATVSVLAVRWRYRDVAKELNSGIVGGLALCIAGSQIFGFSLTGDVLLTVAGSLIYSLGFWISAYFLWADIIMGSTHSSNTCPQCQQTPPGGTTPQYCPHCGHEL